MSTLLSTPTSQIGNLLRKLRDETTTLVEQQIALAKAEFTEKANRMASNAVQLAIGGFVAYAGAIIVLFGVADLVGALLIRAGLSALTAAWLSRALLGLLVAVTGWIMIAKAKKSISQENVIPEKTASTLTETKEWAQQKL